MRFDRLRAGHIASVLFVLLHSCSPTLPPRPTKDCPIPQPQPCVQKAALGIPFDTVDGGEGQFYYPIKVVRGLNGQTSEWTAHWLNKTEALVSLGPAGSMNVRKALFPSVDSARLGEEWMVDSVLGIGCVTGRSSHVASVYLALEDDTASHIVDVHNPSSTKPTFHGLKTGDAMPGWNSQASLSRDGRLLMFASNRLGGIGGTDIWYMVRKSESEAWSLARNLGSAVNTECDELCPYICADGTTLMFASTGHEGYGGYDLFRCSLEFDVSRGLVRCAGVQNLGAPLNGASDELFASSPGSVDELLYFSSNRHGSTGFDLYVRERLKKTKTIARNDVQPDSVETQHREQNTQVDSITIRGRIRTSRMRIVRRGEVIARDLKVRQVVGRTIANDSGDYSMRVPLLHDIEVVAETENGFYDSYQVRKAPRDSLVTLNHDFVVPEVLELRINFPENIALEPYKTVLDSNGLETTQAWTEQLDVVAENLKKFKDGIKSVILVGHTDENGTTEYNYNLGKRRVEFVVEELVKRGVPRALLQASSAGELKPLPRRKDEQLEAYYKRNRRVEMSKLMR